MVSGSGRKGFQFMFSCQNFLFNKIIKKYFLSLCTLPSFCCWLWLDHLDNLYQVLSRLSVSQSWRCLWQILLLRDLETQITVQNLSWKFDMPTQDKVWCYFHSVTNYLYWWVIRKSVIECLIRHTQTIGGYSYNVLSRVSEVSYNIYPEKGTDTKICMKLP